MMLQTKKKEAKKNSVKKKTENTYILFDTTKTYKIPLIPVGKRCIYENEELVSGVKIQQDKDTSFFVKATKEGYQSKNFVDKYFEWLLYTGYIEKEGKDKDE